MNGDQAVKGLRFEPSSFPSLTLWPICRVSSFNFGPIRLSISQVRSPSSQVAISLSSNVAIDMLLTVFASLPLWHGHSYGRIQLYDHILARLL